MTQARPARPSFVFLVPWDLDVPGGVNEVIVNLHRQVAEAGEFDPLVVVNRWSARRPIETVVDGRRTVYFRLSSPWPGSSLWGFLKWLVVSPLFFADFWRLIRRHRVAVFNMHYPSLGSFAPAFLRLMHVYRGRLILSFHGLDLAGARESGRVDAALWRFVMRHTDAVVACSQAFGQEVREFAAGAASVAVIHNGLDIAHLMQSTEHGSNALDMLHGREFILAVAKFERRKGLDVLVRAFAELHRANPQIALVLVGRAGDSAASVHALTQELGLADDVVFFEGVPHSQIGAFFERARVVCVPSRSETFGIVILEAGAFRRPVVASRAGGIPEIIEDGETGLLVEPDDVPGLTRALAKVLGDREFARTMSDRLFHRVETEFTWKQAYAAYRALL